MPDALHFFSYFPQFHPDPINNRAWGDGFTDWDLIRALPESQRDAFTPSRGYYDPSSPEYLETLRAQLEALPLPNAGLMVYHYHFDGVSALSGFERQLLNQPDKALPFFFCWANETWTKRWVGQPGEILIEQRHTPDPELIRKHAEYLVRFFELPHYHRVHGRPLFIIYNAQASRTLPHVLSMYRDAFSSLGHQPLIGACVCYPQPATQLRPYDFACEFEPRFFFNSTSSSSLVKSLVPLKMRFPKLFEWLGTQRHRLRVKGGTKRFDYSDYLTALKNGEIEHSLRESAGALPLMRSVFLSWDNLPRYRKNNTTVEHKGVIKESLGVLRTLHSEAGLPILVNSWNEWSEGAALEMGRQPHALREEFLNILLAQSESESAIAETFEC